MKIGDLLIYSPNFVTVLLFGIIVGLDPIAERATVLLSCGRRERYEVEYLKTFVTVA